MAVSITKVNDEEENYKLNVESEQSVVILEVQDTCERSKFEEENIDEMNRDTGNKEGSWFMKGKFCNYGTVVKEDIMITHTKGRKRDIPSLVTQNYIILNKLLKANDVNGVA